MQEALEISIRIGLDPATVTAREASIIASRIAILASALNLNSTSFSGTIVLQTSARRKLSTASHRRLDAIDTSDCLLGGPVYALTITHTTADEAERQRVTAFIESDGGMFGTISDATGEGDNAVVCVPISVTSLDRETVTAPPPPPFILAQETPPEIPIGTIAIVSTVIAGVVLCLGGLCVAYCVTRRPKQKREKDSEATTLLQGVKVKMPDETGLQWRALKL